MEEELLCCLCSVSCFMKEPCMLVYILESIDCVVALLLAMLYSSLRFYTLDFRLISSRERSSDLL